MIEFKGSHFERDVILWVSVGIWRIGSAIGSLKK